MSQTEPAKYSIRSEAGVERVVTLRSLLDDLRADSLITADDMHRLTSQLRSKAETEQHPLNYIADQQLDNAKHPGHKLTLSVLLTWLGASADQQVFHIDPMKIDVRSITAVMSFAFAKRHQILALSANNEEVVIASAQPFVRVWEQDLAQVLKKRIVRVVADPADIVRYSVEFYTLVNSISSAVGGNVSQISNFEQMLELGKLKDPTSLVADAHAAGLKVHPWTFRRENYFLPLDHKSGVNPVSHGDLAGEIRAYLAAGIDGFFTDNTPEAAATLGH